MTRIRPIAIAVITRPTDGALLVVDGYDSFAGGAFHRPLGGEIELGESAEHAVRRELREELGAELADVTLLGFHENLFVYDGQPGHELIAVFCARLLDESLCARVEVPLLDHADGARAVWRKRDEFRSITRPDAPPLYPDGLAALLGW